MLEIKLLGDQRVTVDGKPIDALRSPRTVALLAYLVVHRAAPQLRRHVAELFWPDSTDAQARTNLRRELHQLRGALPEPDRYLVVDSTTVGWRGDATCRVDLAVFDASVAAAQEHPDGKGFIPAAERAVQAYSGDLLPGLYDDWVLAERERLRWTCVSLLDRLAARCADEGRWSAAIQHARRRVELEPLEESGYRRLITLQVRAGDRGAALLTYHRCASVLERELGLEPSPETLDGYRQLFVEQMTAEVPEPQIRPEVPLVGRTAELSTLLGAWSGARVGPRMVLIGGEAGIGKSRLAEELALLLGRDGAAVGRARCYASNARLALAPVADWLRSPALRPRVAELDPVWRLEVARLVPELVRGLERSHPEPLVDSWQRRRFFEGLARGVLAVERPTLLVLDDLQWCDVETLAWLELLFHTAPAAPILVVATVRSEEREDNAELAGFSRRMRNDEALEELELGPLDVTESAEMAAGLLGEPLDPDAARRLQAETGGFPLFVAEAVRAGSLRSPRVEAVLSGRLAQLSPAADELVGIAAAVGRDFSLELLGAAGGLDDDALLLAVDELWRRRLLRQHTASTYDFSHDLLRDAAYQRLSPPHRRMLHRRLAAAIEQTNADDLASFAAQIADHHERAGQPQQAVRFHVLAAEAATDVFALEETVARYGRALELLAGLPLNASRDEQELRLRVAMTPALLALRGYTAPTLRASLERTIALGEQLGDDEVVLRSTYGLWTDAFVGGRIEESASIAAPLLRHVDTHWHLAPQFHLANAGSLASLGCPAEAVQQFDRAAARSGDERSVLGFRVDVLISAWRAHPLWLVGRSEEAAASADEGVAIADEADHPYSQALAHGYAAISYHLLRDAAGVAEHADAVRTLCDRYGFAYYGEWGRIMTGWVAGGTGGEALVHEGIERLRKLGAHARMPLYLAVLAEVLAGAGRQGEASRVLAEARMLAESHGDRWWLAELWRLDAAHRADAEAVATLERALAVAREHGSTALELRAATDLARRLVETRRIDAAVTVLAPVRVAGDGCDAQAVAAADEVLAAVGAGT